jgi:hypothetical protein
MAAFHLQASSHILARASVRLLLTRQCAEEDALSLPLLGYAPRIRRLATEQSRDTNAGELGPPEGAPQPGQPPWLVTSSSWLQTPSGVCSRE